MGSSHGHLLLKPENASSQNVTPGQSFLIYDVSHFYTVYFPYYFGIQNIWEKISSNKSYISESDCYQRKTLAYARWIKSLWRAEAAKTYLRGIQCQKNLVQLYCFQP
jgi:hypothetical protein